MDLSADLAVVFLVRDRLHPRDVIAVERFLHGNVGHGVRRRSAMPMLLAWRNPDHVTGLYLPYRTALGLKAADAGDDIQRLPERMRMPIGSRAWLEGHPAGSDPRRRRRFDNWVLPDGAGKALLRRTAGRP